MRGLTRTEGAAHGRQNVSSAPTTKFRDCSRAQSRLICSEPSRNEPASPLPSTRQASSECCRCDAGGQRWVWTGPAHGTQEDPPGLAHLTRSSRRRHRLRTGAQLSGSQASLPRHVDRLPAASYRDVQQGRLLDESATQCGTRR